MSIEAAVRERHAFEDRLTNYLTLASVMTDRELELALSRLADMLRHMGDNAHVRFRGQVLKAYLDLRREQKRPHRSFKRALFRTVPGMLVFDARIDANASEHFVRSAANFPLLMQNQIAPPPSATDRPIDETILLLAP